MLFKTLVLVSKLWDITPISIRTTVESLIGDNVTALIGPIGSSAVKNTHPICSGLHIPQVTAGATDSKLSITSADYRYLIKVVIHTVSPTSFYDIGVQVT